MSFILQTGSQNYESKWSAAVNSAELTIASVYEVIQAETDFNRLPNLVAVPIKTLEKTIEEMNDIRKTIEEDLSTLKDIKKKDCFYKISRSVWYEFGEWALGVPGTIGIFATNSNDQGNGLKVLFSIMVVGCMALQKFKDIYAKRLRNIEKEIQSLESLQNRTSHIASTKSSLDILKIFQKQITSEQSTPSLHDEISHQLPKLKEIVLQVIQKNKQINDEDDDEKTVIQVNKENSVHTRHCDGQLFMNSNL